MWHALPHPRIELSKERVSQRRVVTRRHIAQPADDELE